MVVAASSSCTGVSILVDVEGELEKSFTVGTLATALTANTQKLRAPTFKLSDTNCGTAVFDAIEPESGTTILDIEGAAAGYYYPKEMTAVKSL